MIYLAILVLLCLMPAFIVHGKEYGYIVDHPDNKYEPVTHSFGTNRVMRMAPWGVMVPTMVNDDELVAA